MMKILSSVSIDLFFLIGVLSLNNTGNKLVQITRSSETEQSLGEVVIRSSNSTFSEFFYLYSLLGGAGYILRLILKWLQQFWTLYPVNLMFRRKVVHLVFCFFVCLFVCLLLRRSKVLVKRLLMTESKIASRC